MSTDYVAELLVATSSDRDRFLANYYLRHAGVRRTVRELRPGCDFDVWPNSRAHELATETFIGHLDLRVQVYIDDAVIAREAIQDSFADLVAEVHEDPATLEWQLQLTGTYDMLIAYSRTGDVTINSHMLVGEPVSPLSYLPITLRDVFVERSIDHRLHDHGLYLQESSAVLEPTPRPDSHEGSCSPTA